MGWLWVEWLWMGWLGKRGCVDVLHVARVLVVVGEVGVQRGRGGL